MCAQSCLTLCVPVRNSPPDFSVCPWNSSGKYTGMGSHSLLQWDLLDPGIEPMFRALAGRFCTPEPPGNPLKNLQMAPRPLPKECPFSSTSLLPECHFHTHRDSLSDYVIPLLWSKCIMFIKIELQHSLPVLPYSGKWYCKGIRYFGKIHMDINYI